MELIVRNDIKINLIYDAVPDEYTLGEIFWDSRRINIFVKNTKTIKETTGTIIHEVTHAMYGNPLNSIKEEFLCFLRAELHKIHFYRGMK